MKLYHGSYMEIKKPRVDVNVRGLDFGKGFSARYDRQFVFKTAGALKLLSFENSEIVGSDDD